MCESLAIVWHHDELGTLPGTNRGHLAVRAQQIHVQNGHQQSLASLPSAGWSVLPGCIGCIGSGMDHWYSLHDSEKVATAWLVKPLDRVSERKLLRSPTEFQETKVVEVWASGTPGLHENRARFWCSAIAWFRANNDLLQGPVRLSHRWH